MQPAGLTRKISGRTNNLPSRKLWPAWFKNAKCYFQNLKNTNRAG